MLPTSLVAPYNLRDSARLSQRPKSDFSGSQKRGDEGGGEEGRSGARMHRAWRGKRGEKWGKKGGRKGVRKHTRKTLILVPLWFRYSLVAFGFSHWAAKPTSGGSFGRTSQGGNFEQALETSEKHALDIHDPNSQTSVTPGQCQRTLGTQTSGWSRWTSVRYIS